MEPIRVEEIKSKEEYERSRAEFRRRIMVLKARRRVPVGDHFSCHFETRQELVKDLD